MKNCGLDCWHNHKTVFLLCFCFCLPFTDVSPHLVYKRCDGSHATLWPFDLPFPGDGDGGGGNGETTTQNEQEHEQKHKTNNNGCADNSIHVTAESRAYFSILRWCRCRTTVSCLLQRCKGQQSFGVWQQFGLVAIFKTGPKGHAARCLATGTKCWYAALRALSDLPKRIQAKEYASAARLHSH